VIVARHRAKIISILVAIAAGSLLYVAYRDQYVHFSPQSRQCAIAARTLLDRGVFELHPGKPYAIFGPLYPVLLAGLGSLRIPLADAIVILSSATLSLSLLTFFWLARESGLPRPFLLTLFYAALAINPYLFRMARADGIFLLASMLTVLGLARYGQEGGRKNLAFAAVGCILATTARYMGIFALGPLCLFVFGWIRRPRSRRDWVDVAGFFLVAWTPILLWLIRNKSVTGHFTGMSRESWSPFAAPWSPLINLVSILRAIAFDFLGVRVMGVIQVVLHGNFTAERPLTNTLFACAAASLLVTGILALMRRKRAPSSAHHLPGNPFVIPITGALVAFYFIAMLVLWSWGNNDPIHTRFVAPVEWGIVLLGAALFSSMQSRRGAKPLRAAIAAVALAVFVVNVDKSVRLFGEFPGEALILKDIQLGAYAWLRNPTWDREAMYAPLITKNRVVDE
jgi:hypothetical protein